jgi:hypothetical protein
MPKLEKNEFRCAMCKGIFVKGRSDEEAFSEHLQRSPNIPIEETEIICDICFVIINKWMNDHM